MHEQQQVIHPQRVMTPADVIRVLDRWKWMILAIFIVATGIAAIYSIQQEKIYSASAKILLIWMKEEVLKIAGNESLSSSAEREKDIQAEIEIMQSHEVSSRVLDLEHAWLQARQQEVANRDDLAPAKKQSLQGAIDSSLQIIAAARAHPETYLRSLSARGTKSSNIITVNFKDPNPHRAARMVNHVIEAYMSVRAHFYKTPGAITFLDEQIRARRQKVDQLQETLDRYRHQEEIVELGTQKSNLLTQTVSLESELSSRALERNKVQNRLRQLQELQRTHNIDDGLPAGLVEADLTTAKALLGKLAELRLRRKSMLEKYTEDYPDIIRMGKDIMALENQLAQEIDKVLAQEIAVVQTELRSQQEEEAAIRRELAQARNELRKMPDLETRFGDLSRDLSNNEQIYQTLLQNQEQERLKEARNQGEISARLISPAKVPSSPVSPDVQKNISMAAMLSLMAGIGLAFFIDYLDKSVKSPAQIEQMIGLQVLAQLPTDEHGRRTLPSQGTASSKRPWA